MQSSDPRETSGLCNNPKILVTIQKGVKKTLFFDEVKGYKSFKLWRGGGNLKKNTQLFLISFPLWGRKYEDQDPSEG